MLTLRDGAGLCALLTVFVRVACASIQLDVNDPNSIKKAARTAATNMLSFYHGDEPGRVVGLMDKPYYWWEGGAMFGQLINYWKLTGDTQYNDMIMSGIQFQVGEEQDFEPRNRTNELGNDDQQFWAFTVLDAAELGFPDPRPDQPGWLALAQAVFNRQIARWETAECNGGLRWQTVLANIGYNYKNTPSNGGLFHLGARLARYTGNQTYADWAIKAWDWVNAVKYIEERDGGYQVFDGAHLDLNCTDVNRVQWSYNYGTLLSGIAYMYNYTNADPVWKRRLDVMLQGVRSFFVTTIPTPDSDAPSMGSGKIMAEIACEFPKVQTCNQDNPAFKAFTIRWLAVTTQLAPYTTGPIMDLIRASAQAAAATCTAAPTGDFCGRRWYQNGFDGFSGLGEQMSALSVFQNLLIGNARAPVTADSGGTSQGDPNAGTGRDKLAVVHNPITTADKAGAGILTILAVGAQCAAAWWMVMKE